MNKLGTDASKEQQLERREAIYWLYRFLIPQKRNILFLMLLSLMVTGFVVIQPYLTKVIIDSGLMKSDFNTLLQFSIILLVAGSVATLLSGYNRLRHTELSGMILFSLREDVYDHLQKLPQSFFQSQRAGDLISRLDRDIAEIQRFAVDTLFASLTSILGLVFTLAMMLYLNWQLSLILLILVPVEFIYLKNMRPKVEEKNREVRKKGADISAFLAEKIPVIKFIQSSATETRELGKLNALNRLYLVDLLGLQKTEFITSAVPTILVSISRAVVFIAGGYLVINKQLELGALIAFLAYLGMALGPVQTLLGFYLAWQRLIVSLDRVRFIRQQPLPNNRTSRQRIPPLLAGRLSFENVGFSHGVHAPILDRLSFAIPPGCKLGIIGESGIGKTTLLDLIQRHYQPDNGRILVDDHDIQDFEIAEWRSKIAIVPQDPVIFHDTLKNNLLYCNPQATDDELQMVVEKTGLNTLVNAMPDGLNTLVSERGMQFSGGQKQRIALARALLQKPVLLVMDEPTSATDYQTERALIETVDSLFHGITRIIVSHRLEALQEVDYLLEITANQVVLQPQLKAEVTC